MSIQIITSHPADLLERLEKQLNHTDSHWGVVRQNGYLQRSRDSGHHYYYRYHLKAGEIEISFLDVHNEYSAYSVNEYSSELITVILNTFSGDVLLDHLKVKPFILPNS